MTPRAAIRARHAEAGDGRRMDLGEGWQAHEDRGELLAEIREADAVLVALGIPDDGRSLAERIRALARTMLPAHEARAIWEKQGDEEREKGRAEGRREALAAVDQVAGYYPADVFPDDGSSVDAISARAIRHVLGLVKKEMADAETERRAAAVRPESHLTASLPDLGITEATGATPQALAEDVADQIGYVLREFAFADEKTLATGAAVLARRLRAWCGSGDETGHEPLYVSAAGCDECGNAPGERHAVDCDRSAPTRLRGA